jgi:beta-glucosidase-like glycosyl hydrolase
LISQSFESFSEDPHLSGMMASAYVKGLQSGGIGAAIKHFVSVSLYFLDYGRTDNEKSTDVTTRRMTDSRMTVFSVNVLCAKST